jgi:hypothetical protein
VHDAQHRCEQLRVRRQQDAQRRKRNE